MYVNPISLICRICTPHFGDAVLGLHAQIRRDYPLNLGISLSGGKETNQDSPSNLNGECLSSSRRLKSCAAPGRNPQLEFSSGDPGHVRILAPIEEKNVRLPIRRRNDCNERLTVRDLGHQSHGDNSENMA